MGAPGEPSGPPGEPAAEHARECRDPSIDARDLVMFVIGYAIWSAALPQVVRMFEGGDPGTPESRARRRASFEEAICRIAAPRE